jgi:serine/threonine protein kinase
MKATIESSRRARAHLTAAEIQALLSTENGVTDFSSTEHLAACNVCQSKLTECAGTSDWWDNARSFLSSEDFPRWQPDLSASSVITSDSPTARQPDHHHVLELLATPKHPEMLGRLGRYDIERIIGSGGMGVVLKAHDSELNRPIAIKLLAPHLSHVGAARERFAREGRAAAAVVHEHVVAIYNVEAEGTLPFLTMQYVPGHSLQTRVDENGPLAVEELLRIGLQAASGLAAAHAHGLVHRDVKPSNILLEDTVERAVLTDFGLARTIDDATLTQTGIIAGTPHYMSPEQATGEELDARSDLFSLGAVLYFMATGHPPFRASGALAVLHRICRERHRPVRHWNKNIPDELSDIIDRLLEKKPSRRFDSAEQVRNRLARLLGEIQRFGPNRRRFKTWRSKRGRRRILAATTAVCAIAIGIVSAIWFAHARTRHEGTTAMSIETFTGGEREFASNLDAVHSTLGSAARTPVYVRSQDDSWQHEIQYVKRELDRIESKNH